MRRIHEDRVVVGGVVLRHGVVSMRLRRLMKTSLGRVLERVAAVVVMGVVWMWSLALLARMRLLGRVVDIVVRSYSVIARQRVSDAWVPPERTALDGRRALRG